MLDVGAGGSEASDLGRPWRSGTLLNVAELRLLIGALTLVSGVMALSTLISIPDQIRPAVILAHLVCLIVGLGAVLSLDWYALLVATGQLTIGAVLVHARRITPMIWIGLAGLVVSGTLLSPRLDHTLTWVKAVAVLGTVAVGVLTLGLTRRMHAELPRVRPLHFRLSVVLALTSQACWWTAVVIGFINHGG
jgi:hypothetical protein